MMAQFSRGMRAFPRSRIVVSVRPRSSRFYTQNHIAKSKSKGIVFNFALAASGGAFGFLVVNTFLNPPLSPSLSSTAPLSTTAAPRHDLSPSNLTAARSEFASILGDENIDSTPSELLNHSSTDWSPFPTDTPPSMILCPSSTEDVSAIMKICHARKIPVTGYSGGTSLDGALASTRGGVSIDFKRMGKILAIHERDLDVAVQPSVGWMQLNEVLDPLGLWFPVDPAPGAKIGGMVGTGCSGTNAYRYGPMKDWTLGLTVVLADGSVVCTRHRPRKSSAGYDLTRLIVGSSGTLALVTEVTLKLTAKPQNVHVAVVPFPTIHGAINAVISIVQQGFPLGAIELLDETKMKGVNQGGMTGRVWAETPTLFLKFDGEEAAVRDQLAKVKSLASENGSLGFEASGKKQEVEGLWKARKHALPSFLAMKRHPEDTFLSSDVAVPISKMADLIKEMHVRSKESGLLASVIGHVGDGNFHFSILYSDAEKEAAEELQRLSQRMAVEMEGTVTGEHGIGLALRGALKMELGDNAIDMMRKIKLALDPLCLLNCDKIIRMQVGRDH